MTINLVFADPHPVMLDGLMNIFEGDPEFNVNTCVNDGESALNAVEEFNPDVLVLELSLPKKNGLEVIQKIHGSGLKTRPVVFTYAPIDEVMKAIDLGVQGLVGKDKSRQFLTRCIKAVSDGNKWLDEDLAMGAVTNLIERQKKYSASSQLLTPREMMVAKMVTEGWPNKRIASKLSISEGTTKLHLHHIYQKLQCQGRMALVLYMQKNGLA